MILRRLGNKSKIAHKIIPHFPKHNIYIELFFGAGGMFFNKPKSKYNFLNDLDSNVTNCFEVLIYHKDELKQYIEMLPQHSGVWEMAKKREPKNNIEKAVFFLFLSNFGYMGIPDTLRLGVSNSKKQLLNNLEKTYLEIVKNEIQFTNYDFRDVLNKIGYRNENEKIKETFIYCDPPYLETGDNYSNSFKENDSNDLFDVLQNSKMKWAMSEFDNPFILEQVKKRNLNIIMIGERRGLKNRRTEILITNYTQQNNLFNDLD